MSSDKPMERWSVPRNKVGTKRVVVIQRVVPHYRVPFFKRLFSALAARGVELRLLYGREREGTVPRTVVMDEVWAVEVPTRYFAIGNREFVWQTLGELGGANLVIVEHAGRLLNNYYLLALRKWGTVRRLAFWGHGGNFQVAGNERIRESIKGTLARQVDHWFAYSELSRNKLIALGVVKHRITVVNNAIDTASLISGRKAVTKEGLKELSLALGIIGNQVGLYCGGLKEEKRIEFLLSAASEVRRAIPEFELIVIGDGPESTRVKAAARKAPWIKYVGAAFGEETIPYFSLSRCLLMPGPVGLVILDALALGVPLVTTNNGKHGPEIAYLRAGENGVITDNSLGEFVAGVVECLEDNNFYEGLVEGCVESSKHITLDSMVERFVRGIMRML